MIETFEVSNIIISGIQGNGKLMIIENAKKIIDDLDTKSTKTELESMKYRRAREILQNLA